MERFILVEGERKAVYETELSLQDYVQVFLRRWWVVALTTIACTLLALVWTARQTPQYSSSASVLINQANAADLFDPVGTGTAFSYAERLAATEARFLTSGLVADAAIDRLGYEAYVSVAEDDFADVLNVTATSEDPIRAQEVAQTYAETYVDVREQRFASERTSIANQLAERLAEIDLRITDATGADLARLQGLREDVAESLDLLTLTAGLAEGSGSIVIDDAFLPGAPFTPRTNRNVALGFVLGLMSGAGLILLLESLDRSVKSREILESLTPGSPNLSIVPSLGKSLQRRETLVSASDPTGASAEAFRTLRAALQYVAVDDSARVIQIASAHSAAGKTTVAANLAITLAQAGQRVVVIDADLRRPRLHQLFDVPQVPGLTSAIIGSAPLGDCIQRMEGDGSTPFVLPSGPIPPGPAELLGSSAGARVIDLIRDLADYVIIDTPPVLPVADTLVLSRYVDASILVVDASKTKRADVVMAYERLAQAGAPVIGTVLNKVKRRFAFGGYGYGYGYGGYGGYQADGGATASGLKGWFSGGSEGAKIERLHGKDIPQIQAAPIGLKPSNAPASKRATDTPSEGAAQVAESNGAAASPTPSTASFTQAATPEADDHAKQSRSVGSHADAPDRSEKTGTSKATATKVDKAGSTKAGSTKAASTKATKGPVAKAGAPKANKAATSKAQKRRQSKSNSPKSLKAKSDQSTKGASTAALVEMSLRTDDNDDSSPARSTDEPSATTAGEGTLAPDELAPSFIDEVTSGAGSAGEDGKDGWADEVTMASDAD